MMLDHFIVGLVILRLLLFVHVFCLLVLLIVTALVLASHILLLLVQLHGHRVLLEKWTNGLRLVLGLKLGGVAGAAAIDVDHHALANAIL